MIDDRPLRLTQVLISGGGPVGLCAAVELGLHGQGEAPRTITVLPAAELQAGRGVGSCGRSFAGVQVQVVDPHGAPVPARADGEIWVRGEVVMPGYWENPEASAQALAGDWLHTGDIGHFDDAGYLHLTDRAKDVIITGGSNVYPREVEEVLLSYPGVREVAVIGVPDPGWGSRSPPSW